MFGSFYFCVLLLATSLFILIFDSIVLIISSIEGMIVNKYRRKPHELEEEKENYQRHLARLEEIKGHKSQSFARKVQDEKKLWKILSMAHQRHRRSRQHEATERAHLRTMKEKLNCNRVKSVVKDDFSRAAFLMPRRQPKEQLQQRNERMYQRILNTKPLVLLESPAAGPKSRLPLIAGYHDFSHLLRESKINTAAEKRTRVRLGKGKSSVKLVVECCRKALLAVLRDKSELYQVEVRCGELKSRTEPLVLEELLQHQLHISAPKQVKEHPLTLAYFRVLPDKELYRGEIVLSPQDMAVTCASTKPFTYQAAKRLQEIPLTIVLKSKGKNTPTSVKL